MKVLYLSALLFVNLCLAETPDRFFNMSPQQIDSLLQEVSQQRMTITERMYFFSTYFLETPYSFTCVGDGPYALLENYPLVNFKETNCMALCEHILALSISDSWDNFFNNLQQIRYRDGMIGMRTRNHYTMADWLPQNSWLLQDVAAQVAGEQVKKVSRIISHRNFFRAKGIHDMRHVTEDRDITIDYIPLELLPEIVDKLQNGDIGALIFADKSDIFSAHMFLVFHKNNKVFIRESSNSKMSTFDTEYPAWVQIVQGRKKYIGIALMRVRPELNRTGKIIFPTDIEQLKHHQE